MIDHALAYAAGLPVFPCHSITATGACTCGKNCCYFAQKKKSWEEKAGEINRKM